MMFKLGDIDRGYDDLKKRAAEIKNRRITVGVHANKEARPNEPPNNVDIATFHEYGTEHIPERSFLRATLDANGAEYVKLCKALTGKVLAREMTVERALGLLGEKIKADVVNRINQGIAPPLSPETIKRKGSSKPLVDTGSLKQSIDYVVQK